MTSSQRVRLFRLLLLTFLLVAPLLAQQPHRGGGEANLILPDLDQAVFFGGIGGRTLLMTGLVICALGLAFGLGMYTHLRKLPVHASMLEISELIYETCKTYLITQGKFLLILEMFIGAIIVFYFGFLQEFEAVKVLVILLFSIIGIGGSFGVAWFGIRVNTFANSRTAFASLTGKPFPCYAIPLKAGIVCYDCTFAVPGDPSQGMECVEKPAGQTGTLWYTDCEVTSINSCRIGDHCDGSQQN